MLLSPLLQKSMTAALALPVFVLANSSYADCSSGAALAESPVRERAAVVLEVEYAAGSGRLHYEAEALPETGERRLSRRAFYGEEAPVAITDL